jgi:ribokinase
VAGRVVVVGSVNRDLVVRVDTLPRPGQTVTGATTSEGWGGKGANMACAAARLGAPVVLVAAVGDDAVGRAAAADLEASGVVPRLQVRAGVTSGQAVVLVAADGENVVIVAPGANADLDPSAVEAVAVQPDDVVVLSAEAPVDALYAAGRAAADAGARLLLNASPVVESATALAALQPVVVVNEHEAAALSAGAGGVDAEALRIGELTGAAVVVTLGRRGAVVRDGTGPVWVPAPEVVAVDTTGAGDTFLGALAAELLLGRSLVDAAATACQAAAFAVTGPGARWQPTRADLRAATAT